MTEQYLAYSQITTHRQCPQRWNYAYHRRLEKVDPADVKVELEFGNWWHALRAADSIERGLAMDSLRWVPEQLNTVDNGPIIELAPLEELREQQRKHGSVQLWDAVVDEARQWWKTRTAADMEAWEERIRGHLPDRLQEVDTSWRERWKDDLPHEQPLAVELKWEREMPSVTDPVTGEKVSTETMMIGYVDELYFDTRRNVVAARDHKTHRELGTQTSVDDMMDSQLQIYAWGASPIVSEWGLGQIRAVAYDRARMAGPRNPSVTASGTLSKSVTDYDLATYLVFAAGPDGDGVPWGEPDTFYQSGKKKGEPKFGKYTVEQSVIDKLSDPAALSVWHQRTLSPLNMNVVVAHLRAAADTALDVRRTRARVQEQSAAPRNLSRACQWCPFSELCRAEMVGGAAGEYDLEAMWLREKPRRGRSRKLESVPS